MKKFFILFAVVFTMFAVNSSFSLPNFWFSAVAYNTSGQIITYGTIEVNITIFDGTTTFTENYLTSSALSTDAFGIFNVQIGTGSNSGNLSSVLMKSNTTITVKVRPVATLTWVTVTGTQLSTVYFNTYVNANVLVPALPNGQIFVGNSSNVATPRTMSGDATLNNSGVLNINPGVIVNADINAAAAIDVTKLAPGTNGYFLVTYNGNTNAWTDPYSLTVLRAVNLKNGVGGDIPYQTGANTTTFLGIGTPNKIMTSTGTAPQWVSSLNDSQLDDNLTINGGTVNNTIIGGTTPAVGTFTNLTVNGTSELKGNIFNSTGDIVVNDNLTVNLNTNLNGNINLGDATSDMIYYVGKVNSNILPAVDNGFDLGSSVLRWKDFYSSGTINGSNLYLTGNLNVDGNSRLGNNAGDNIDFQGMISNTLDRVTINDGINQTGAGQVTFSGNIDALNGLDVTNTSTFAGVITQTGSGNQVTFSGNVDATNGLDVTGNNFTVDGVFSISQTGVILQSANQQVTFTGNVDATNGLDVSGNNFTVTSNNDAIIGTAGSFANSSSVSDLYVQGNIESDGNQFFGDNSSDYALFAGDIDLTGFIYTTGASAVKVGDDMIVYQNFTQNSATGTNFFNANTNFNADVTLGNANTDNVVFTADVNSNITPNIDAAFDLGTSSQKWRDINYSGTLTGSNGNFLNNLTVYNNSTLGDVLTDLIYLNGTISNNLPGTPITIADGINQTGASQVTFSGNVDATNGLDVSGNNLTVATNTLLNGNITLGDANTDNIVFIADVNSNILPNTDNTYDLGSAAQSWKDIYFDGLLTGGSATINNVIIPSGGLSVQAGGVSVNAGNLLVNNNIDVRGQIYNAGAGSVGVVINDYVELWNTISNPTAQNGGKVYVGDDFQVTGSTDLNGSITNTSGTNGGKVYVGDDFQVTGSTDLNGSITNTSGTNGGKVWVADDFQVAGSTYLASVSINGALNDGVSNGNNGQVPIADGTGNWSWSDMAGSFAIKTDNKSIVGDGTTANPIRVNTGIVIITDVSTPFDVNSPYSIINYTGNAGTFTFANVNASTKGRVIWIFRTGGSGNLNVDGNNMSQGTASSFIYNGTNWMKIQ